MARKSLYPSPAQPFSIPPAAERAAWNFVSEAMRRRCRWPMADGQWPMAGASNIQLSPGAAQPLSCLRLRASCCAGWSDAAVQQRRSSPGFLPAFSSYFKSPGQLWLPIPTPARLLIFLGAGIVSTVYLARCKSSLCWDMYSGAALSFFFFSLSFYVFFLLFFFLNV